MKIKKISFILICLLIIFSFGGCKVDFSFDSYIKTSDDGFKYYVDKYIGLCILEIPKTEEVLIPEFIDGIKVAQLGFEEKGLGYNKLYTVDGSHVKKLTVQHTIEYYSAKFDALETLVYYDYLYCILNKSGGGGLKISNRLGGADFGLDTKVHLVTTDREYSIGDLFFEYIVIPEYVEIIEKGTFEKLTNTRFETAYSFKPDGWEDSWDEGNSIIWDCVI